MTDFKNNISRDPAMLQDIKDDIKERSQGWVNSMSASPDEVRICWLIAEVDALRERGIAAKNCLVCAAIADPIEVIENTLSILEDL